MSLSQTEFIGFILDSSPPIRTGRCASAPKHFFSSGHLKIFFGKTIIQLLLGAYCQAEQLYILSEEVLFQQTTWQLEAPTD